MHGAFVSFDLENKAIVPLLGANNYPMLSLSHLKTKLFADGADKTNILELARNPLVQGFTTNPSLMRQAGVANYEAFARDILTLIPDRPISFEVFADDPAEMEAQAHSIASWGSNVYVKIPVTNTRRQLSTALVRRLSQAGVKVNVTALMTLRQVWDAAEAVSGGAPSCISVFAGRVADTGRDPLPLMTAALEIVRLNPDCELIWASTRELLDIVRADAIGCHIITVTTGILKKLELLGKDLDEYSLETVRGFHADACRSGYTLQPAEGAKP